MTPKPRPPKRADGTLNALCKALGLEKRRISELLKMGMPDDPQAALAWRNARENDDTAAALRRERIGLVKAQRLAAELANQKAKGELIARADVSQQYVIIATALNALLRKMESDLPPLLLGLSLSKSLPATKAYIRNLQNKFSEMDKELWKNLPPEEEL
jgi:phage terminase Nu1 subunit (DNA packaging protein)